jgi:hypothetical protein
MTAANHNFRKNERENFLRTGQDALIGLMRLAKICPTGNACKRALNRLRMTGGPNPACAVPASVWSRRESPIPRRVTAARIQNVTFHSKSIS